MLLRIPTTFLAAFLLFLTGCGDPQNRRDRTVEIGVDPSWYPLNLAGKENSVLAFSTELLKMISLDERIVFSLLYTSWDNLQEGLESKRYEGMLSSLHPYNFNLQRFDFSDIYLKTGPVLVVPKTSAYRSLHDMRGKQVAVQSGTASVLLLESEPGIFISSCDSVAEVIDRLQSGDAEAALLPLLTAQAYTEGSLRSTFMIVSPPLNDEGIRLVTLKNGNPELIRDFNRGLRKLRKTGFYDRLLSTWNLIQPGPPS